MSLKRKRRRPDQPHSEAFKSGFGEHTLQYVPPPPQIHVMCFAPPPSAAAQYFCGENLQGAYGGGAHGVAYGAAYRATYGAAYGAVYGAAYGVACKQACRGPQVWFAACSRVSLQGARRVFCNRCVGVVGDRSFLCVCPAKRALKVGFARKAPCTQGLKNP